MLYNFNKETFKIVSDNGTFKLYHKAENKWSSGWTFIGRYKTTEKAEIAARQYSN